MGATSHVSKWGSSLAVRIPKSIAEMWGVDEGSAIDIVPQGDEVILRKKRYDLAELVAQITPDNEHPEVEWGAPRGDEVW